MRAATVVLALLLAAPAWADVPAGARALFERYQTLERSFDPALADLYADDAVIRVTRIYANGVVRHLKIPGDLYQMALRQSMADAAAQGDFNQFSAVDFKRREGGVEVTAQRYNLWRNYTSPYRAMLRPGADGQWQIAEEYLETRVPQQASE